MIAQDQAESTKVTISYGRFINQFLQDTMKSMRQLQKTYKNVKAKDVYIIIIMSRC